MRKHTLFKTTYGWVGCAVIIIAAVIFSVGIWFLTNTVNKNNKYVKTESTVVEIAEVRVNDHKYGGKKILYAEVVEYEVAGKKYRAQNNSYTNMPEEIGKKINICYDPDDPENCVFPSSNIPATIVIFALAIGFLIAGVVLIKNEIAERKSAYAIN